jgi:hypothetical protein
MKNIILAAVTALSLGTSVAAFAQPGAAAGGLEENYGTSAFTDHRNAPQVHFLGQGTVVGRLFGHSNSDHAAANKTDATPAKGS